MRSLMLAAVAAFALAAAASAQDVAPGPYHRDDNGNCHAANGHTVHKELCGESVGPYKLDDKGNCHASDGHIVKRPLCGEPPKP